MHRGFYRLAERLFEQVRSLATSNGGHEYAHLLLNLGRCTYRLHAAELAEKHYTSALRIAQEVRDARLLAILANWADVAISQAQYSQARTHLVHALQCATESGDDEVRCEVLFGLGIEAFQHGDYAGCISHWNEALSLAREHRTSSVAYLLGAIGISEAKLGRFDRGSQLLYEALVLAKTSSNRDHICAIQTNLAWVQLRTGRVDAAEQLVEETLRFIEEFGRDRFTIVYESAVLGIQAHLAAHRGDLTAAHSAADLAVIAARKTGREWALGHALQGRASGLSSLGLNFSGPL